MCILWIYAGFFKMDLFFLSSTGCMMPGTGNNGLLSSGSRARIGSDILLDLPDVDVDAPPPPALAAEEPPPPPPLPPPLLVDVELDDDDPAVADAAEEQAPELQVTEVEVEAGLFCCGGG